MKLNLGASDRKFDGFLSVDIVPPADIVADLSKPWPWPDSSVDTVLAYDVIEHVGDCGHSVAEYCDICVLRGGVPFGQKIRHPLGRIHFMNELWRTLKPGARATIETPNASRGAGFFQDPTHKTPWCLNSFQYFQEGSFAVNRLAKSYGITARFNIVLLTERPYKDAYEEVWKIHAILEAVK